MYGALRGCFRGAPAFDDAVSVWEMIHCALVRSERTYQETLFWRKAGGGARAASSAGRSEDSIKNLS